MSDTFESGSGNNDWNNATNLGTLSSNYSVTGLSIHITSDVDWFKFQTASAGETTIDLNFLHKNGDLDVKLYDQNYVSVASSESGYDDESIVFTSNVSDTYTLQVYGFNTATNQDYDLSIKPVTSEDSSSDTSDDSSSGGSDDSSSSTPSDSTSTNYISEGFSISYGEEHLGSISNSSADPSSADLSDYYKLSVVAGRSYAVRVEFDQADISWRPTDFSDSNDDLGITFKVYNDSDVLVGSSFSGMTGISELGFNAQTSGDYYVVIESEDSSADFNDVYALTAWEDVKVSDYALYLQGQNDWNYQLISSIFSDVIIIDDAVALAIDTSFDTSASDGSGSGYIHSSSVNDIIILDYDVDFSPNFSFYFLHEGDDHFSVKSNSINTTASAVSVYAGEGNDSIAGFTKGDSLYGGRGNDILYGNDDHDDIWGGENDDILYGGSGDDTLFGDNDYYRGDHLLHHTGSSWWTYSHTCCDDATTPGVDTIYGGSGNDLIFGDGLSDHLTGGAGRDTFAYQATSEFGDIIYDFTSEDYFYISDRLIADNLDGVAFDQIIKIEEVGSDVTVSLSAAGNGANFQEVATLKDVLTSSITKDNFIGLNKDTIINTPPKFMYDTSTSSSPSDERNGTSITIADSNGSSSTAIPNVTLNLIDSSSNSTSFTSSSGDITLSSDLTISHVTVTASSSHQYSSGIDLSDVGSSLRHFVGLNTLTGQSLQAADVDNDGSVSLSDVGTSLRAYVGLTTLNTFDLVDSSGNKVTDIGSSSETTLFLVENGDVSLDGAFVAIA